MFDDLMTDRVTIRTQDGKTFTDVKASVQKGQIICFRTDIPLRPGDHVVRTTPAGVDEVFVVEDPGLHQGLAGIPASYQMRVRRTDALPAQRGGRIIYNITGPNARFNVNSVDASTNIVNQAPAELFDALRAAIQTGVAAAAERDDLLKRAEALQANLGQKSFGQKYAEFMALAASHMETIGPFIPALTQLLMGQRPRKAV